MIRLVTGEEILYRSGFELTKVRPMSPFAGTGGRGFPGRAARPIDENEAENHVADSMRARTDKEIARAARP
jgi:hypothetical protein